MEPLGPDGAIQEIFQQNPKPLKGARGTLERLLEFGGFPDPFLTAEKDFHRLWLNGRIEKIVREDLRDLSRIQELSGVEMLMSLLPDRAGQLLSVKSLQEDLEVAHTTVTRWLKYLEDLYYSYLLRPYTNSVVRSLKKEPKLFLWDWSEVSQPGQRFENLIANHLLKACHYWTDSGKGNFDFFFVRNKEKEEVDFLIVRDKKPWLLVEAKHSDGNLHSSLLKFMKQLKVKHAVQVVYQPTERRFLEPEDGLRVLITPADLFLTHLV